MIFVMLLIGMIKHVSAIEIALSFDDAPFHSSAHFKSADRTAELIKQLKKLNIPPVMIFAAPCRGKDTSISVLQLKTYVDAGHLIANHTCSHPRLDDVGYDQFTKDIAHGEKLLSPLMSGQKFFRFPYLNESNEVSLRDQVRAYLNKHQYRNGYVSIDTYDYLFNEKINKAKNNGKIIDYKKVEALLVTHIIESINFYDDLAIKTVGYSPKHVLLLHEMDATVLSIESIVNEIRMKGWKIINIQEAYSDKIYMEQPKNTYANDGFISQLAYEKFGKKISFDKFEGLSLELDKLLGLESK